MRNISLKIIVVAIVLFLGIPSLYAGTTPGEWLNGWKETKSEVQTMLGGKKKPAARGLFGIRLSSGIEKALSNTDKAYKRTKRSAELYLNTDPSSQKKYAKNMAALKKHFESFKAKSKKYKTEVLSGAIEHGNPNEKKAWAILKKDLTVIKRSIDLSIAKLEADLGDQPFPGMQENADTAVAEKKLRKELSSAKKFLKKVEAKEDVEYWNRRIKKVTGKILDAMEPFEGQLDWLGVDDDLRRLPDDVKEYALLHIPRSKLERSLAIIKGILKKQF